MRKLAVAGQTVHFGSSESMDRVTDGSVDLIVTSPPYWNLKDYGRRAQIGASSYDEYLSRLDKVWEQCHAKAKPAGVMVVNVNIRRWKKRLYPIPFDIASRMRRWVFWDDMVWYVPNALPQPNHYRDRLFDNKFEHLLVFLKSPDASYKFHKPRVPQKYISADPRSHKKDPRGRCLGNVVRIPAYRPPDVKTRSYHAAAFPEELAALLIHSYTDAGDTVLDPFLGSGTTLKVARVMGRKGVGYEINTDFAGLIEKKILEPWAAPDWRSIDMLHSTTMETGMSRARKSRFDRA